jgi:predicted small secreted protein
MSSPTKAPLLVMAAMIGALSVLAACNTVEGVGEDAQAVGRTVEETAQQTNDGNPNTP